MTDAARDEAAAPEGDGNASQSPHLPFDYCRQGWAILPCHSIKQGRCTCGKPDCASPGKHPRTLHGVKDATSDEAVVRRWIDTYGGHDINWAVATGDPSGVMVIDIDPRHGGDESFTQWELENGSLPVTRTTLTGGGGLHYYVVSPQAQPNKPNFLPGVDLKATGGYAMLPNSRHVRGRQYVWRDPEALIIETPSALLSTLAAAPSSGSSTTVDIASLKSIPDGERNDTLFRLACRLRRLVKDDRLAVEASVRAYNQHRCETPLIEAEVSKIIDSAFRQDHDDDLDVQFAKIRGLDDNGNAYRLIDRHGDDIRYLAEGKRWLVWDGTRFAPDSEQRIVQRARDTAEHIADDASFVSGEKAKAAVLRHAAVSLSAGRISAMASLARSDERTLISAADMDRDPNVLNAPNGIIDLRTGELRPHDRSLLMSKRTGVPYDPSVDAGPWERFLLWAMCGRSALVDFLQELFGYAATGHTGEQVLALFVGPGANGKTTVQNVLHKVLGDYALHAEPDLLTGVEGAHPTGIADLHGRRLVIASETREGRKFDERTVKQLTGSDPITARRLYQDFFTFDPTHTIVFAANHRPIVTDDSHAMWRRLLVVPWDATVEPHKKIGDLVERFLFHNGPGILAWLVEGARRWYERGHLLVPDEVRLQTQDYREEQDELGEFIAGALDLCEECFEISQNVFDAYIRWCDLNRIPQQVRLKRATLVARLSTRNGISQARTSASDGKKRGLLGLRVRRTGGF